MVELEEVRGDVSCSLEAREECAAACMGSRALARMQQQQRQQVAHKQVSGLTAWKFPGPQPTPVANTTTPRACTPPVLLLDHSKSILPQWKVGNTTRPLRQQPHCRLALALRFPVHHPLT
mmetsp:Transcript_25087/g.68142  ORF Transcript_25087/g.68142 Transcript_25087/m.68142 type:complete len:120 (-) Transcript_25087:2550-2909(-)